MCPCWDILQYGNLKWSMDLRYFAFAPKIIFERMGIIITIYFELAKDTRRVWNSHGNRRRVYELPRTAICRIKFN